MEIDPRKTFYQAIPIGDGSMDLDAVTACKTEDEAIEQGMSCSEDVVIVRCVPVKIISRTVEKIGEPKTYRRREKSPAPLATPSSTEPPPNTSVTGIASTGAVASNATAADHADDSMQGDYSPPQQTPTEALVGHGEGEPEYDLEANLPPLCDRRKAVV